MKTAVALLSGIGNYTQGRRYTRDEIPASSDTESFDDYEKRTWRERMHHNENGTLFIPPIAFKDCILTAALKLRHTVPGKGKSEASTGLVTGKRR